MVGTRGRFTVTAPFTTNPTSVYVCKAVRSLKDLYREGIDVYQEYYQPNNLTVTDLNNDDEADANIVTLVSYDMDQTTVIYIPDTYIESFPDMGSIQYNRVVLSVDFGLLPDYVDLSQVKTMIESEGSLILGSAPTIIDHTVDYTGFVSAEEHDQLEVSRLTNVQYSDTERAKRMRAEARADDYAQRIATLEQIIIGAGLV